MKPIVFHLFLAVPFFLSFTILSALGVPKKDYGAIEISYDAWGIPHVVSETDAGAFYGLGYVTAMQRGFQMHYNLRIIQGRCAEAIGNVTKVRGRGTALQSDKAMRTIGYYRAAKRLALKLEPEAQGFLQAYSEGVNDYFIENDDQLHYLFDRYDIYPELWTPADCIVSWWHMGQFFSPDGLRELAPYHRMHPPKGSKKPLSRGRGGRGGRRTPPENPPVDDAAAVVKKDDVEEDWLSLLQTFYKEYQNLPKEKDSGGDGPKFSHAWVIGKDKSKSGSAVLVSDPQTPVRNPSMFYEYHIKGETLNARGIGVPGSPALLIGWNKSVAWGLTALGADQADLFLLQTDNEHPGQYLFDGEWRDFRTFKETIYVKDRSPVTLVLKESHLGPVVNAIAADVRPTETVVLKRVPICEQDRDTFQASIGMMRAQNARQFSEALKDWRFPNANIVYGDAKGTISYSVIGAIPLRPKSVKNQGRMAYPVTTSDRDWIGFIPYRFLPQVTNPKRGYLISANHRPIQSFYPLDIGISTGSLGDTQRSWRLRELLERKNSFIPEEILEMHYDMVNPVKREILRLAEFLRYEQQIPLEPDSIKALDYLHQWHEKGARSDMEIQGTELANQLNPIFRRGVSDLVEQFGGGTSGLCYFLKTRKAQMREEPEFECQEAEITYIQKVLQNAWRSAKRQYGDDPSLWQTKALKALQDRTLGYYESLNGFPSLDPEQDVSFPFLQCIDGGTIHSQVSQSYTQWVPLHDVDQALSILPIGQTEQPDDPYRKITYHQWAKGELHPAPITMEGVEKYVIRKQVLTNPQYKGTE